jgi:uncharacterized membrane protein
MKGIVQLFAVTWSVGVILVASPFRPGSAAGLHLAQQPAGQAMQAGAAAKPQSAATYAEVARIISEHHCTICHGGGQPTRGLALDTLQGILKGSAQGPAVIPGNPEKSELLRRLTGASEPRMPITGPPWLPAHDIAVIERWIAAGAPGS